ncbi:TIGR03987 family protein [Tessaracoccus sp. MC1679]|nr:HsmA family protein [Tessaracoccus sp. MC1679]MBB1515726.1 TIGR03987 family protein [Tessaracoccus sp. MC1679]
MSGAPVNPLASTFITAALVFYSVGVWGERVAGRLRWWNFVFFVLGLACDTVGTGMMFDFVGGMTFDVHGISGLIAILLMLVHAVWAGVVLIRKDEAAIKNFHRFSVFVWAVWLIPYFSPMFFALAG